MTAVDAPWTTSGAVLESPTDPAPSARIQATVLGWFALPRRVATLVLVMVAIGLPPLAFSLLWSGSKDLYLAFAANVAIAGLIVLSLVVISGFVGQISFCQYSFSAIGAFTVGALVLRHHWSFWIAWPVGILASAAVGVLVGIPALRLQGLFLAILTVAVALLFDRWLLATGTADFLSGGRDNWSGIGRPSFLGIDLTGPLAFYYFCLAVFLVCTLLVWNLRKRKTGRVLRAVRDSEVAAATMGLDLTAWKLSAFGISAGLAGAAGGLFAVGIGSVSPGSYDFQQSLQIAAVATVWGVGSVASPGFAAAFLVFVPEILTGLHHTFSWFPKNTWFNVVLGAALVIQLVLAPDGVVVDVQHRFGELRRRLQDRARGDRDDAPATGAVEAVG